jgi:site-specific DNA-methyltransferase (adenine-specific)
MMINRIEAKFPDSYRNGNVLMIHGDCMDVMAHIQDNEAELSCVDPPYGIGEDGGVFRGRKGQGHRVLEKKNWDNERPTKEYFQELKRVSKNQIIWGANHLCDLFQANSQGWIYWDKMMGGDFSDGELAFSSFDTALRSFRFCNKYHGKIHPTEKPPELYKWLLTRYAKPAELILDTHGGSGSIVIACHDLGHPIIWVEKDADYFRDAVARYKTHASQAVLFEPVEIMKEQKLFEEKQ